MTRARVLLYAHCPVVLSCTGLVLFALGRRAELGWQYDRQLEELFQRPVVSGAYQACMLSCLAFPIGVACCAAGRVSGLRWCSVVTADIVLALVQWVALMVVYPVRV